MSLYIHIPFCRQACSYCDFHFSVNHERIDDLVTALADEIRIRKNYLQTSDEKPLLETIYFGGGTPSLLNNEQLERIFGAIKEVYRIAPGAEITLEANPDDLTIEKLRELQESIVNRLSIGVQSFFDDDLVLMNRAHNAQMANQCIKDAHEAGFENLTIDLIYGIPGMTEDRWKQNLEKAFSLPVNHLSCYCLTIEHKTLLEKLIREGKVPPLDEELSSQHFAILIEEANKHGFEHYEISNFSKPGFNSRHNSNYWHDKPYIGIGPSAHSYNGISRQWNISSNAAYVIAIRKGEIPSEQEILTIENRYNEYVMTGLRTIWGVDLDIIRNRFGERFIDEFLIQADPFLKSGDILVKGTQYTLSNKGKLIADRIAARAFIV